MPYFTAADGNYPYRPLKQADPVFRRVRETAERTAAEQAMPDASRAAAETQELEAG
jgi:hypothetical protein